MRDDHIRLITHVEYFMARWAKKVIGRNGLIVVFSRGTDLTCHLLCPNNLVFPLTWPNIKLDIYLMETSDWSKIDKHICFLANKQTKVNGTFEISIIHFYKFTQKVIGTPVSTIDSPKDPKIWTCCKSLLDEQLPVILNS